MSGFLVDTNVLSERARGDSANQGVRQWFDVAEESSVFLSVVTLGEIRNGIEKVSDVTRKTRLEKFFAAVRARFGDRILSFDEPVAERWGRLRATAARAGVTLSAIDSLVAATALQHDLTLVTRNERDFRHAQIPVLNPFS